MVATIGTIMWKVEPARSPRRHSETTQKSIGSKKIIAEESVDRKETVHLIEEIEIIGTAMSPKGGMRMIVGKILDRPKGDRPSRSVSYFQVFMHICNIIYVFKSHG